MTAPKTTTRVGALSTTESSTNEGSTARTKTDGGEIYDSHGISLVGTTAASANEQVQPGAVHVQGIGRRDDYSSSGSDSDFDEDSPSPRPELDEGGEDDEEGLLVSAHLAPSELVAPSATAIPPSTNRDNSRSHNTDMEYGVSEKQQKSSKRSSKLSDQTFVLLIVVLVVLVLAVGIIVGLVVGLNSNDGSSSSGESNNTNDVGDPNNNSPTAAPTTPLSPREAEIALRLRCIGIQRWAPSQSLPTTRCPVDELNCNTATTVCPERAFEDSDLFKAGSSSPVWQWAANRNRCPGLQRYSPDPDEQEDCPIEAGCNTATACPEIPFEEWESS